MAQPVAPTTPSTIAEPFAGPLGMKVSAMAPMLVGGKPYNGGPNNVGPNNVVYLSDLICPSTSLCLTYDSGRSGIFATTDPSSGTWRVAFADTVLSLACPSAKLCVAITYEGVVTSTDPTGGPKAWHLVGASDFGSYPGPNFLGGVTCASVAMCLVSVGDAQQFPNGGTFYSTDPAGGASTWHQFEGSGQGAMPTVCPTTASCFLPYDNFGGVEWSTDPLGGPAAWNYEIIDNLPTPNDLPEGDFPDAIVGITCPSASLCLARDEGGGLFVSTDPTGGTNAWHLVPVVAKDAVIGEGVHGIVYRAVCASASFCMAVGGGTSGAQIVPGQGPVPSEIYASRDPGDPASWVAVQVPSADLPGFITCPTPRTCVLLTPTASGKTFVVSVLTMASGP